MTKLELTVGDTVQETYRGHYSHREYHGEVNTKAKIGFFSLKTLIKKPRFIWRPRTGTVVEIQPRWWGQDGCDVRIQWKGQDSSDWRLADTKHLRVIKRVGGI